jgi:NADH-quinone oxidoreductase subunit E
MSVRRLAEIQPASFDFTPENLAFVDRQIAKYPEHRQASAVIPLLWQAQKQNAYWLPKPAIEKVADMLGMPYIRVLEIATFYTMFNLEPVGKFYIQMCGTTPCVLRGSDAIRDVLYSRVGEQAHVTPDGLFSWREVECLGACCNAPMVQINDDYYEDLTVENFSKLLDDLAAGRPVTVGSQTGRKSSEPVGRLTSLVSFYGETGTSGPAVAKATPTPADAPFAPGQYTSPSQPATPSAGDASAPSAEGAAQQLKREQDESIGRPDPAGQRSDPRQDNPVNAQGKRQDDAASGAAEKA